MKSMPKPNPAPIFAGTRDTDFAAPITPDLTCGGRTRPHPRRWERAGTVPKQRQGSSE